MELMFEYEDHNLGVQVDVRLGLVFITDLTEPIAM